MGGTESKINKVHLTAEEHFIAHQLLCKIYPDNFKLAWALSAMCGANRKQVRNNKMHGWIRRHLGKLITARNIGHIVSVESRAKMSAARLGRKFGNYQKHKNPSPLKGRPKSPEHRLALANAKIGTKRGAYSAEHRGKISEGLKSSIKLKAHHDRRRLSRPNMNSLLSRMGG
jgi:hypothetical protein